MSNPELPIRIGSSNSARIPASLTSLHNPRKTAPALSNSTWNPVFIRGSRYTNSRILPPVLISIDPLRWFREPEHAAADPSYLSAINLDGSVSTLASTGDDVNPSATAGIPLRDHARPPSGSTILIVEDDVSLGKFLSRALRLKLFSVDVTLDGEAAWETLQKSRYDLVILDLNLPRMDGMALLARVRQIHPALRMLVLTARNRTEDMVLALEQGADDCLVKPFSFLELLARIRGLLRRDVAPPVRSSRVGDLIINREEHRVMRGQRWIDLTPREFAILDCLVCNAGKAVSRGTLMREVWNTSFDPTTNIIDVYMKYLRDKIDAAGEVKLLHTVRGVGYALRND